MISFRRTCDDLASVLDMDAMRGARLKLGRRSAGRRGRRLLAAHRGTLRAQPERRQQDVDPTFRFMTLDWDGKIRMDCSSPYAMAGLIAMKDRFDVAFGCDTDHDRHGIVTQERRSAESRITIWRWRSRYLFRNRPGWRGDAGVGKTLVSSSMIDRVAASLERRLVEVPVGFKWFVDGLVDGSLGFGGEESAGASFLRRDGTVWTTDKDGIILGLLSAEITARTGRIRASFIADLNARIRSSGLRTHRRARQCGAKSDAGEAVARAVDGQRTGRRADSSDADEGAWQRRAVGGLKVVTTERLVRRAAFGHRRRLQDLRGEFSGRRSSEAHPERGATVDYGSFRGFREQIGNGNVLSCMHKTVVFLLLSMTAQAADLGGEWSLRLVRFGESFATARVSLKADGGTITGTLNELKLQGTVQGDQVRITGTRPDGKEWGTFEGRLQGDEMSGTAKQGQDEFAWNAQRAHVVQTAPQSHTFEPTAFQRVFSGAIAPVLHINPGDTVKTWTVDAGGMDAKGVRRNMGGNPETGPFFVEGAMPGDTLSIKFQRVRLNRDSAMSGDRIVPGAVQGRYYRDAKFDEKFDSNWKIDRENGVASLAKPTDRLKNFKVKLQPMLGCVGVAPPMNQSYRAGWLGSWGGNMDYKGVREGVTVYLPVYQEGALLFVGDGHAVEGDGELNGDALETSMDVEFTVNLIRGKSTQGPRFEDDEYLMASGIAGSLNDALQQATTELALWLERDYKLSPNESNVVLGTSIRYDIAEVVDPQFHIVAKVSKSVLAAIQ